MNLKVHLEAQKTITKAKLSNIGGITVPDFKLNYRSIAIKTV
jgi:hypothetical protein